MDKKEIEELIDKRILEAKLAVTESRLNHVLVIAGALLAVFGIFVPIWLTNTSTDKTDKAIERMEQRFKELAGEALKKPTLELLYRDEPLDNQIVEISSDVPGGGNAYVNLRSIFLRNTGNRKTEPLSIKLLTQRLLQRQEGEWEEVASSERNYSECFYSTRHDTVAPGETLNMHYLYMNWQNTGVTNAACKLEVFYGGERQAEATFQLRLKQ